MAVLRLLSRGRCLLSLTTPSIRVTPSFIPSIKTPVLKRGLTASRCSREEIVQTPSRGPEIALTDARASSTPASSSTGVALLKIPKRWARSDVEQLLVSKGCTIKRLQLRIDRFSFQNDTKCFVELGSEAEATKVIEELNRATEDHPKMVVRPLKADFDWKKVGQQKAKPFGPRYFYDEDTAAYDAIRPLLERRRIVLSVMTPGWSPNTRISVARSNAEAIIERYFGKYGIESVSDMSVFQGDKKILPRMLCTIDFKTKEGAENAVNDHNETQIEGRLTRLTHSEPAAWRLHQIQKVAGPETLKALQESGVVPEGKEIYEDKFVNPLPKK